MLRIRGLLIASVLALVLGGVVYWSNKQKKAEEKNPDPSNTPVLLTLSPGQLVRVEWKRPDGETTIVEKQKDDTWTLVAPKPYRVDQSAVNAMINTAVAVAGEQVVMEKGADLKEYGLVQPSLELLIKLRDGKTRRVLVGDETPTGGSWFASVDQTPRVYTIAGFTKTALDKTAADLRDKRLLTFNEDKLSRVELTAKGQTVEFGRNSQNEWQIVRPRALRADGGQVDELIRRLRDAQMDALTDDETLTKNAAGFNAGAPVAVARVTDASGTQELALRKSKDNDYYLKSSVNEGVFRAAADLADGLNKGLDDFRNRKLFDFGWNDPGKVEIREGANTRSWQKSGENWTAGGKKMDPASVNTLIDKLRELSAAKFVEQSFPAAAAVDLTVTSSQGKRTEKVQLSQAGSQWLARRENEPTIYELDATTVDELKKAAAAVKEAAPEKKK